MVINLQKGQSINLEKDQYDLSSVTIGLGWDVVKKKGGSWLTPFSKKKEEEDFDLDAIAFLLDSQGKVAYTGNKGWKDGDVIFYHNLRHPSGNIYHTGDNRTGEGEGEGDDEQLIVNLNHLEQKYDKIVFLVTIYEGRKKKQDFGQVENAFIRAVDAKGQEMFRYDLSRDKVFDGKCSMIFGEIYRKNGDWKFRAIGTAYDTDNFGDILKRSYR